MADVEEIEEKDPVAEETLRRARPVRGLRVGDPVVRVLPVTGGKPDQRNPGEVSEVTGDVVAAVVEVDLRRTMRFSRATGVNVLGPEYGYLERG